MNILIAGDSLALPRPHRINNFNPERDKELAVHFQETYGYLLQQELSNKYPYRNIQVVNRAQRFFTIKNICDQFVDHLFFFQPDVIVMQVGIVDCWFRKELGGEQLVNRTDFQKYYDGILYTLKKRPETKLIIIGICPTSVKMEGRFPGILNQISLYNQVLRSGVDDHQVFFLDMEKHVDPNNPHVYLLPDDHHLNKLGNQLISSKLSAMIQSFIENEQGCLVYEKDPRASYEHFCKSFELFPRYGDNLYNLISLSFQLQDWNRTTQFIEYVQEHRVKHPALPGLIKEIMELMA